MRCAMPTCGSGPVSTCRLSGLQEAGKSTLLNIIALLDRHTAGRYWFGGTDVNSLGEGARSGLRAHRIGFVFQSFHLLAQRTVTENVMMSMLYSSVRHAGNGGHGAGAAPGTRRARSPGRFPSRAPVRW